MPTMVLLAVVSLLVLAVIVLVAALYLLDSHADQQSKRLQDLMQGSVSGNSLQRIRSQNEFSKEQNSEVSCQTCRICGGTRNRRPHGPGAPLVSDACQVKSPESSRPWSHLMAVREILAANMENAFECLTSRQKSQTKADIRKQLFSLGNSFRVRGSVKGRERVEVPSSSAATSLSVASCSSKGCGRSASSVVTSQIGRGSSAAVADRTGTMPSASITSSMVASVGSSRSSMESTPLSSAFLRTDSGKNMETEPKSAPFRRLVLEILMSPSAHGDGQVHTDNSASASGVRLKLETNATLEHLASLTSVPDLAFELKDAQKSEQDAQGTDVARLFCLPVEVMPIRPDGTDRVCTTGNQDSSIQRQNVNQACFPPEVGITSFELPFVETSAAASVVGVDAVAGNRECAHVRQKVGALVSVCPCTSCQKGCGDRGPTTAAGAKVSAVKNAASNAKVKLRITSPPNNGGPTDIASVSSLDDRCGQQHSLVSEGQDQASFVSLDGLGSLRITFLKAGADGKMTEECTKEVSAQVASALAALNVNSASTKIAGTGVGLVSGSMNKDEHKNRSNVETSCTSVSVHKSHDEGVQGEGSDSERGVDEGDEHALKCKSCEDDAINAKKKEKKKKKNRGRKQKGKASASISEAQERQEIGKIVLEAAKHVSAVPEAEIGCVCGTPKGSLHSNSCPYPFTSSGSMLQRKIKEQYDELVRSNAAKTLTLAQVGRFTTCLVEAKAALQQKSEMIQRRFTIAKSLLAKADKSSFDRLCGQIYGLEIEQKKLEEDTVVYNRLQEQLKLSPAYQKMLEYGRAHFELQPHTGQMIEKLEPEDMEMSFEELLAQEKKDGFWQKHGLSRSSVQVS